MGFSTKAATFCTGADALAARPDVAVVGLGLGRRDAEGDDAALLHGDQPLAAARAEFLDADHQMVRGQRQHRLGAQALGVGRCGGHRRARIAARRLDQDVDLDADFLGLLLDHEAVGIVGGDHRLGEQAAVGHALQGLLEGRLLAEQRHELLGHALARQGPQALAGASDQDDGRDQRHLGLSLIGPQAAPRMARCDIAEGQGGANGDRDARTSPPMPSVISFLAV